ncbi:MAG: hypothetical protein IJ361_11165 [Spirochaetaceae bacterium]|nr:hypothetical protein [Spirochaetaceae bacterium]
MNAKCFIEISCLIIGTIIAVFGFAIPLFIEWCNKPKLKIDLNTKDSSLFTNFSFNNEFKENLSLKIEVENTGKLQADDVQLTIQHVRVNNVPSSIPPMNLYWSYQDDRIRKNLELKTQTRILGNTKQHCDFIFLIRQNFDTGVEFGYFVSENDQYLKIIDNGTYEIELSIGMLGSKAEKYIITFNLDKSKKEKTDIISNLHITQKC